MHRRANPHSTSPPEKGSFPLDHFQECGDLAEKYRICLSAASGIPKKCKEEAMQYLNCRMEKGLMKKQSMEELGFIPESSWEYEKLKGAELARKINQITKESRERVRNEILKKKSEENKK